MGHRMRANQDSQGFCWLRRRRWDSQKGSISGVEHHFSPWILCCASGLIGNARPPSGLRPQSRPTRARAGARASPRRQALSRTPPGRVQDPAMQAEPQLQPEFLALQRPCVSVLNTDTQGHGAPAAGRQSCIKVSHSGLIIRPNMSRTRDACAGPGRIAWWVLPGDALVAPVARSRRHPSSGLGPGLGADIPLVSHAS